MVTKASHSLFLSTMQQPSPQPLPQPWPSCSKQIDAQTQTDISDPYILAHGENTTGKFDIHTLSKENEDYFISSNDTVRSLITTMAHSCGRCPLHGYPVELPLFDVLKHGHVVHISVGCMAGHSLRWNSSSIIGGKYTANLS